MAPAKQGAVRAVAPEDELDRAVRRVPLYLRHWVADAVNTIMEVHEAGRRRGRRAPKGGT